MNSKTRSHLIVALSAIANYPLEDVTQVYGMEVRINNELKDAEFKLG